MIKLILVSKFIVVTKFIVVRKEDTLLASKFFEGPLEIKERP